MLTYYKQNDVDEWNTIGTTTGFESVPIHLGLFSGVDQGDGELSVQFDYFTNNLQ
jgi:hypothetical protein